MHVSLRVMWLCILEQHRQLLHMMAPVMETDNTLVHYMCYPSVRASLEAQTVKTLPAVRKTLAASLGQEDPLE